MQEKLSDKTIWILAGCALLGALVLIVCLSATPPAASARLLSPSPSPSLSPAASPLPTATPLPQGYRLPLVPIYETPNQTSPPTPSREGEEAPLEKAYSDGDRAFLAAGFLQGEPVALFMVRQQGEKLTVLSLCPQGEKGEELSAALTALKIQAAEVTGVMLQEYVYIDLSALPALGKGAGAEEAFVEKGQRALSLEGEERAEAMLLLGTELFDGLKDLSPLSALLLQGSIQGQWGSSLKLSRLWPLGSAMKKCTERVLVTVPRVCTEEQKKILKNFFVTC